MFSSGGGFWSGGSFKLFSGISEDKGLNEHVSIIMKQFFKNCC